jgi:hypothetical protein
MMKALPPPPPPLADRIYEYYDSYKIDGLVNLDFDKKYRMGFDNLS